MKLRAITLTEVRQFIRPVRVAGITDGVNVLAEPNESGKSTLFDALHAVFFIPHRSARIRDLKPDVGGNPEISVDIEDASGAMTIRKRWGRGAFAEVLRGGIVVARADEAEAMIASLTQAPDDGGPAGLLWVRQGVTEFDGKDGAAKKSREDLMSSVTGEFEALTGGKRMDLALARAREELDPLVTSLGKSKKGGPLEAAEREVEALEASVTALEARAGQLQGALIERRRTRKALADLQDPAEVARRTKALELAETAFTAAEQHALKVAAAASALKTADLARAAIRKEIDERARTGQAAEGLARKLAEAKAAAEASEARAATEVEAAHKASDTFKAAQAAREAAEAQVAAAAGARARRDAAARREALSAALEQAQAHAATLPELRQQAATGPDAAQIESIDRAARDLAVAEGLARAAAPHLRLDALPDAPPVTLNGAPLGAAPMAIPEAVALDLPGIGRLHLDPGTGDSAERLAKARKALAAALAGTGAEAPESARAAARARIDAAARLKEAQEALRRLAPEGIEALRAERDALPAEAPPEPDLPAADAAARAARQAEGHAQTALDAARARAQGAREATIAARHDRDALAARLDEARARLADLPEAEALDQNLAEASAAHDAAEEAHHALSAEAPDLDLCRAARDRARSVQSGALAEINRLGQDLARHDATIAALAGESVEAELADARERLIPARDARDAHLREVQVLRALIEALEGARAAARDRYFEPVLSELRPMLRLLWPGAELRFDGDSLLPSELLRDDRAERIGSLSGGTREQISLLVRLAFARLLAKSGRHAPVILDDALVYTDDDRMGAMFDALTLQAADLQILVLSCRNRALRDLGGNKLRFEDLAAPA